MVVAAVEDDLGRHVLGRAAERPRLAARADSLRKAKIHLHVQPPMQVTAPVHMNYRRNMVEFKLNCIDATISQAQTVCYGKKHNASAGPELARNSIIMA